MTTSRILTTFSITAGVDDGVRVYHGGSTVTHTIAPGDHTVDSVLAALKTQIDAAFSGTWTAAIVGVSTTSATLAEGRIRYSHTSKDIDLLFSHAGFTADPRIFGFASTAVDADGEMSGFELDSDHVHRFGWYPALDPVEDLRQFENVEHTEATSGGYVDGVHWAKLESIALVWDFVQPALVRIAAAASSGPAGRALLTTADPNASFEAWAQDLIENSGYSWTFYPDATDTATTSGPFRWREGDPIRKRPAGAPCVVSQRGGELWRVVLNGREAKG